MPRDVSLSDSKCWNGEHEWVIVRMCEVQQARAGEWGRMRWMNGIRIRSIRPNDRPDGKVNGF